MSKVAYALCLAAISIASVGSQSYSGVFQASFENLDGWQNDSAKGSPKSYDLTNGVLRISTRAQTRDRVKIRTVRRFGAGRISWRVYVPTMGEGSQASVGAFLYKDDKHELDFEIGCGKAKLRKKLQADETDLVCYCTSQGHPSSSSQILLKRETWYVLSIDIAHGRDGKYLIAWFVNDKQVKQLQTDFGAEVTFTAHCSVENLSFIGDHIPTREHYALFDYVEVEPYIRTKREANRVSGN